MASLTGQIFDGSIGFTDTHDNIQSKAGNVMWFNEFAPSGEERIAEAVMGIPYDGAMLHNCRRVCCV